MSVNDVTANLIAGIDYRYIQTDDTSRLEEHGIIDYNLTLSSGTGFKEVNSVWYSDREFTTTDSVSLASLSLSKLGQTFTTSFLGVSNQGNVKGVKLDNQSGETIYLRLPFSGFSGNLLIPASGSIILSNASGWPVSSSNPTVNISGSSTGIKNYSLGFVGVASPLTLNLDNILNLDYASSGLGTGSISGILLIEYLASSVNTGTLQLEYLISQSSVDETLNIEYLSTIFFGATGTGTGIGSGTGTMIPIDYLSIYSGMEGMLEIEWTGFPRSSGSGGTGFNVELLQNPRFDVSYVPCEFISRDGCSGVTNINTIGYPHWYMSGDYITYFADENRDFILGFSQWFGHWSDPFNVKCINCLNESYIKQTVTVVPGGLYKFEWFPRMLSNTEHSTVGHPTVKLISRNGDVLAQQTVTPVWMNTVQNSWQNLIATATDDRITVEFRIPADKQPGATAWDNNYLVWGGPDTQNKRVSLYRIG